MLKRITFCILAIGLFLTSCNRPDENTEVITQNAKASAPTAFTYPIPLADFSDAAQQLLTLSPDGLAIGEVHGQLAGIMMLEAVMNAALAEDKAVLILHEFTPTEAGLKFENVPQDEFRTINMTDRTLPFWTDNIDKRATWELHAFFERIENLQNVELSYLWDGRLNPKPNRLKAHGFAERWKIAREAHPDSYIIALGGNYHTSSSDQYDLAVANSMCRYADEVLDIKLTCISMDNWLSPNENCKAGRQAIVLKGEDRFPDCLLYRRTWPCGWQCQTSHR